MNELLNKQITVIAEGLNKPCGGMLVSFDDRFLVLEANSGNTIRIPISRICSILTRTDSTRTEERKNDIEQ